jgi:hypothetical protein
MLKLQAPGVSWPFVLYPKQLNPGPSTPFIFAERLFLAMRAGDGLQPTNPSPFPQVPKSEPTRMGILSIPLKGASYRYYKLVLKPVAKLPLWHSGKGSKGWVMVDEVFFY